MRHFPAARASSGSEALPRQVEALDPEARGMTYKILKRDSVQWEKVEKREDCGSLLTVMVFSHSADTY